MTVLVLVLYVLVAARLTRLVNYDTVLDPVRLFIARRTKLAAARPEGGGAAQRNWTVLAEFLSCPWCVGMWISVALAPLPIWVFGWPWWTWAALPWAASHLVGIGDRWVSDPLEIIDDE